MASSKARVAVIGTGGTISSVGRNSLDIVRYGENNKIYQVDELLNAFPETLEVADVVPVRLRAMPSTAIGPPECNVRVRIVSGWAGQITITIHSAAHVTHFGN